MCHGVPVSGWMRTATLLGKPHLRQVLGKVANDNHEVKRGRPILIVVQQLLDRTLVAGKGLATLPRIQNQEDRLVVSDLSDDTHQVTSIFVRNGGQCQAAATQVLLGTG